VVELVSHKVAVMYLGRIVEMGLAETIARAPRHPYTQVLWSSAAEKRTTETGVFDFEQPARGCRFAPRCPLYQANGRPAICTDPASEPRLREVGNGQVVACHFA
jgi:oligopeptide/dipeptide ABC transporter ATP-binding protein